MGIPSDDNPADAPKIKTNDEIGEFEDTRVLDYEDPEFNKYLPDQPGFDLDDGRRCRIVIRNVAPQYTDRAMRNLCGEFGDVCQLTMKTGYLFVEYGSIREAQQAVEQINRMCKPMKAEFARPRETKRITFPQNLFVEPKSSNEPPEIRMEQRKFLGPFTNTYKIQFPKRIVKVGEEEYDRSYLGKLDPTHNFFNETVLCDLITTEEDKMELESSKDCYRLENFIWTYKIPDAETAKIQKFILTSEGTYDEARDVHSKPNPKFESLKDKFGKCIVCNNLTTRKGKTSGHFFCSYLCQQQLQQKDPESKDTSIKNDDFQLTINEFNRNGNVVITSVASQNVVYVRPCDQVTTDNHNKILQEVTDKCQNAPIILRLPKVGDLVAVQLPGQVFYRGVVLKAENLSNIRVALFDTGEVTIQTRANLRKLPQALRKSPVYARKIVLKNVPNDYFNLNAVKILTIFALEQQELSMKLDESTKTARLYQQTSCVNDELISVISIDRPEDKEEIMLESIPEIAVTKKDSVQMVILNSSSLYNGMLSCINIEYLRKLEMIHHKVQVYGSSLKLEENHMYAPKSLQVCLIRLEDTWYRAVCVEIVGDQHPTMQSIDYGFVSLVHVKNIVPLPEKLKDKCFTQDYGVDGFDEKVSLTHSESMRRHSKIMEEVFPVMKVINVENITKKENEGTMFHYIQSQEVLEAVDELIKTLPKITNEVKSDPEKEETKGKHPFSI